jgi:hypothetical protein
MIVLLRSWPSLGAATYVTVPFPKPEAGPMTVIQSSWLTAVHGHDGAVAVTCTESVPPNHVNVWLVGMTWYVQPEPCETVNVCPAMVIVPLRAAPVFKAAVNPTVPFPVPAAPLVTVIHASLLTAVQAHAFAVLTPTFPEPLSDPTD